MVETSIILGLDGFSGDICTCSKISEDNFCEVINHDKNQKNNIPFANLIKLTDTLNGKPFFLTNYCKFMDRCKNPDCHFAHHEKIYNYFNEISKIDIIDAGDLRKKFFTIRYTNVFAKVFDIIKTEIYPNVGFEDKYKQFVFMNIHDNIYLKTEIILRYLVQNGCFMFRKILFTIAKFNWNKFASVTMNSNSSKIDNLKYEVTKMDSFISQKENFLKIYESQIQKYETLKNDLIKSLENNDYVSIDKLTIEINKLSKYFINYDFEKLTNEIQRVKSSKIEYEKSYLTLEEENKDLNKSISDTSIEEAPFNFIKLFGYKKYPTPLIHLDTELITRNEASKIYKLFAKERHSDKTDQETNISDLTNAWNDLKNYFEVIGI